MSLIDSVLDVPLHLEGDAGAFSVSTSNRQLADGLLEVDIVLQAEQATKLPDLSLTWEWPSSDIHSHWRPLLTVGKALLDPRAANVHSRANGFPPVSCLLSQDGRNRLTVACDEVVHEIDIAQGPSEPAGMMLGKVRLVAGARPATTEARWTIRFDRRDVRFEQSLREVSQWWETLPGCKPAPVPDGATLPVYSTWCAFWQEPDTEPVLAEARLARDLGCGTLILDDGWQTMQANQAYAFCGEWKNERMGDMSAFVGAVHDLGMKCLLWYPIALVGYRIESLGALRSNGDS
jgi:alpha-galactosidase